MKKAIFISSIGLALAVGITTGVYADSLTKEIKALLDPTIKIVYNNENKVMKDSTGNVVYPISYNGSTYIPVRAVSDIFSQAVDYDSSTNTVYLGARDNTMPVDLVKNMGSGNKYCWKITDATELTVKGDTANATFSSGIQRSIWNSTESSGTHTLIPISVSGKSTLTFTAWSNIATVIFVMDEKGGIITSFKNPAGSIVSKEINISGYSKIAFAANSQVLTQKGTAKFFDPQIK